MARICKTTPRDENGNPVRIRDSHSAADYLTRFFETEQPAAGSFSRFITVNGYSSSATAKAQPNQALLKSGLADVHVLAMRAAEGDQESLRALGVLKEFMDQTMALHFTTPLHCTG